MPPLSRGRGVTTMGSGDHFRAVLTSLAPNRLSPRGRGWGRRRRAVAAAGPPTRDRAAALLSQLALAGQLASESSRSFATVMRTAAVTAKSTAMTGMRVHQL